MLLPPLIFFLFFFNDTATTEIYTLSLHDALPISLQSYWKTRARHARSSSATFNCSRACRGRLGSASKQPRDRKSTRLNSSHGYISYAVFCLKKKKKKKKNIKSMSKTETADRSKNR